MLRQPQLVISVEDNEHASLSNTIKKNKMDHEPKFKR